MKNIHYTMPPLNLNILEERALLACQTSGATNDIQFEDGTTVLKTVTGACRGDIPAGTEIQILVWIPFDGSDLSGRVNSGHTGTDSKIIAAVFPNDQEQEFIKPFFQGNQPGVPYCLAELNLKDLTVPSGFCLSQLVFNADLNLFEPGVPYFADLLNVSNKIDSQTLMEFSVDIGNAKQFAFTDGNTFPLAFATASLVDGSVKIGIDTVPLKDSGSGTFDIFVESPCRNQDCLDPVDLKQLREANRAYLRDL